MDYIHERKRHNRKKPLHKRSGFTSDPVGTRTQGPYIKSVLLYQLSYEIASCSYYIRSERGAKIGNCLFFQNLFYNFLDRNILTGYNLAGYIKNGQHIENTQHGKKLLISIVTIISIYCVLFVNSVHIGYFGQPFGSIVVTTIVYAPLKSSRTAIMED